MEVFSEIAAVRVQLLHYWDIVTDAQKCKTYFTVVDSRGGAILNYFTFLYR